MKQVTTHKRVGDVEHARCELRGQPHEFAQYQFHLDKLHAKRVARERRKEAAKLEEPFPFVGETADRLMREVGLMKDAFGIPPHHFGTTVGYGMTDANPLGIDKAPLTATEMKKATEAMDRAKPWHGLKRPWEQGFKVPTVDEMLKADAAAGSYVRGHMSAFFPRDRNDVEAFLKETSSPGSDEVCPVMRDGRVIGTMSLSELWDTPKAVDRIKAMIRRDDIQRDTIDAAIETGGD